ncbi:MAG: hypothetical protein ACOY30_09240 [Bacillota bacterium]
MAGWLSARVMLPGLSGMIAGAGFVKPNYRGEKIPLGVGVVFLLSAIAVLSVLIITLPGEQKQKSTVFLLTLSVYTFLGIMDDFWGDGTCRGLRGHFKKLFEGRLTTGCLKAFAGGLAAFYLSAAGYMDLGPWHVIPLDALIIALSVNTINLLDLRPGRAGKCFLFLAAIIFIAFPYREELSFAALTAGCLLAYLPADLKARAMMGDSGSNALGAVLGITAAWVFDFKLKSLYLAVLVLLHILAEKKSLTNIIASNRMLDYLDKMGRR